MTHPDDRQPEPPLLDLAPDFDLVGPGATTLLVGLVVAIVAVGFIMGVPVGMLLQGMRVAAGG